MKNKILIAIICNYSHVPIYFMESAIKLLLKTRESHPTDMMRFSSCDVNHMRNMAVRFAVENKYTHIFQLDVDMIYPEDSIVKLIKHNKDFVVGSSCQKNDPYLPTQYKVLKTLELRSNKNCVIPKGKRLMKIGASGVVGALIKTSIFKKIRFPYFLQIYLDANRIMGGDIYFCKQLKDSKIDMYLDPTLHYLHESKNFVKLK